MINSEYWVLLSAILIHGSFIFSIVPQLGAWWDCFWSFVILNSKLRLNKQFVLFLNSVQSLSNTALPGLINLLCKDGEWNKTRRKKNSFQFWLEPPAERWGPRTLSSALTGAAPSSPRAGFDVEYLQFSGFHLVINHIKFIEQQLGTRVVLMPT